jgi:predicted nucleic acid-binding protein
VESLTPPRPAVFDTSIFVGRETRGLGELGEWAPIVSVVTLAELQLGVEAAATPELVARRLKTLRSAQRAEPVGITVNEDVDVISAWVTLRRALTRKMPTSETWIAATALALGVPVLTQDDDYDAAHLVVEVIKI